MRADWYGAGQQIVTLNRACVAEEIAVDHCVSGSNQRFKVIFIYNYQSSNNLVFVNKNKTFHILVQRLL